MTKIIFYFAGTRQSVENYKEGMEGIGYKDDVIRVYLRGCEHKNIGGNSAYPDLKIVANKIRSAFDAKSKTINLEKLESELGDAMTWNYNSIYGKPEISSIDPHITHIGLAGYSRGGVSTFASALALDDLDIPIDIIADQPIPGQLNQYYSFKSLYSQYNDLTQCRNVESATILLCSYDLENDLFAKQMIAKFPTTTSTNIWLMPVQKHNTSNASAIVSLQIQMRLVEAGYAKDSPAQKGDLEHYKNYWEESHICYTPEEFRQEVFGAERNAVVSKAPLYLTLRKKLAKEELRLLQLEPSIELDDDQVDAIVVISKLNFSDHKKRELVNFICSNKNSKLITMIDKLYELRLYACKSLCSTGNVKVLEDYFDEFLRDVIINFNQYLSTESVHEKKALVKPTEDAFQRFKENKALSFKSKNKVMEIIDKHIHSFFPSANKSFSLGNVFSSLFSQMKLPSSEEYDLPPVSGPGNSQ
ncbi:hypothetical protein [Legionella fairfieldensis]|uniref:hypothetical protein n=1 Tax=Legionella fairfieldensis TaxID=45064 RepID=UPI00049030E5|nr:hypothetical protein [Legionella fairfieldensis]